MQEHGGGKGIVCMYVFVHVQQWYVIPQKCIIRGGGSQNDQKDTFLNTEIVCKSLQIYHMVDTLPRK